MHSQVGQPAQRCVVPDKALSVAEKGPTEGEGANHDGGHREREDGGRTRGSGDEPGRRAEQGDGASSGECPDEAGECEHRSLANHGRPHRAKAPHHSPVASARGPMTGPTAPSPRRSGCESMSDRSPPMRTTESAIPTSAGR